MNNLYILSISLIFQLTFLSLNLLILDAAAGPNLSAVSNLPIYCSQLCGEKRRRDGEENWSNDFKICTCWDSPGQIHVPVIPPRGCHQSIESQEFNLKSVTLSCNSICNVYLEETIGTDTAKLHEAFSCTVPKGYTGSSVDGKLFCLCDLVYSSTIVNFVPITDSIEDDYGYKVKILD